MTRYNGPKMIDLSDLSAGRPVVLGVVNKIH